MLKSKKCSQCGKNKPLSDFYKRSDREGLKSACKGCYKKQVLIWIRKNPEKWAEIFRKNSQKPNMIKWRKNYKKNNPRMTVNAVNKWKNINPQKVLAHKSICKAKANNKIIKKPCFVCGIKKVHAHHQNYNNVLDVIWLCSKHHRQVHRKYNPLLLAA